MKAFIEGTYVLRNKEMKESENPVSLQIVVSRHCVDMHACMRTFADLYVWKLYSIYELPIIIFTVVRFHVGFKIFVWLITDGIK